MAMQSGDKVALWWGVLAALVAVSVVAGGVTCEAKRMDVRKACIEAGHKPGECG